ncbi:hypothetical protein Tco_1275164 [Tanacetum coccineum]
MDASGGSGSNSPVWPIVGIRGGPSLIEDDNGAVDMDNTMDNLEERIANLEMVFAYLKNKQMLERQETKPQKETSFDDDTADEDIADFEVSSKSKISTTKAKKVTGHKPITKAFPAKIPVPIRNCILGLAAPPTCASIVNKTFGIRKLKDAVVVDRRRKIPNVDPSAGIFAHYLRRLSKYDFVSLDSRLNSKISTMGNFFGSDEYPDQVRILQSCNGLLPWKIFKSCGCLLLVCRDDIGSNDFTIYEMMKGTSVWYVRYLVNIEQLMHPLPEGWSIQTSVWSICLGEGEEDAFMVINISGKVVKYNLLSKTNTKIFDLGSYDNDDVDDDDDDDFDDDAV